MSSSRHPVARFWARVIASLAVGFLTLYTLGLFLRSYLAL